MSFRVKLRITSMRVDPYRRPAPIGPVSIPKLTDPTLLQRLYEAARQTTPPAQDQWTRTWIVNPVYDHRPRLDAGTPLPPPVYGTC